MRLPLLVLALLLTATPAHAGGQVAYREPYLGQPLGIQCDLELPTGPCPADLPNSRVQFGPLVSPHVQVRIDDASGERIGARWEAYDADGAPLGVGGLCARTARLTLPAATTYLALVVDVAGVGDAHCPRGGHATSGEVVVKAR